MPFNHFILEIIMLYVININVNRGKRGESMIIIGVCDAEPSVRIHLTEYINRYKIETGCNIQILAYNSGEALLKNYTLEMDIIFLEVSFTKLNGIEIARRIRLVDKNVKIIFLTSLLNHVLEAYEVNASNYLIKPLNYNRFVNEINKIITQKETFQNKFFIEKNENGLYKVYIKTIKYIETYNRKTMIHTEDDDILSYKQMKEHEAMLQESIFVRCHTGFIVNLNFFSKLDGNEFILMTGERIPVSRQRKTYVMEQIQKYYSGGEGVI
jgi:two-component system, LytTR family, response regulator LytT